MICSSGLIHLCVKNMKKIRSSVQDIKFHLSANRKQPQDHLRLPTCSALKSLQRMPVQDENKKCKNVCANAQCAKTSGKSLIPNRVTPDTSGLRIAERDKARYVREKGVYKPKRNCIGTKGKRKPEKPALVRPRQAQFPSTKKQLKSKHSMLKKRIAEKQTQAKLNLKKKNK